MTDQDRYSLLDQTLVRLFKPFSQLGFYLGCVSSFSHLIPDQVPYTPLLIFSPGMPLTRILLCHFSKNLPIIDVLS